MTLINLGPKGTIFFFKYGSKIILFILVFGLLGLCTIFFEYLSGEEASTVCYALFVANGIGANLTFALGRSAIFIEKHSDKSAKRIYNAGILMIIAAFISLLSAGFAYMELNLNKTMNYSFFIKSVLLMLSIFLSFASCFTFAGIIQFFRGLMFMLEKNSKEWKAEYEKDPLRHIIK